MQFCSKHIYIYKSRQQVAQTGQTTQTTLAEQNKKKKKEECEAQSAKYPTEKVHLLDAFCAQHPEHRSL